LLDVDISKEHVSQEEEFIISWEVINGDSAICELSSSDLLLNDLDTSGSLTQSLNEAGFYIYTINCSGEGYLVSRAVQVEVEEPADSSQILNFFVSDSEIYEEGEITLGWNGENIDYTTCTTNGWISSITDEGTTVIQLSDIGVYDFELTCESISKVVTVTVERYCEDPVGSEECPILIENCHQLGAIEMNMGLVHELANDIDCAETKDWIASDYFEGFIQMGTSSNLFSGILDGNNMKITNLHMKNSNDDYRDGRVGLFYGTTSTAIIKDLIMENWTLLGYASFGGLVTINQGNITNVSLINSEISSTTSNIGGLFYENYGFLENITMSEVNVTGIYTGGMIYKNSGDLFYSEILESIIIGTTDVGGMCQLNYGNMVNCIITDSDITGGDDAGGMILSNYGSLNSSSVQGGTVEATDDLGGLVYDLNGASIIHQCYTDAIVNSLNGDAGGLVYVADYGSVISESYSLGEVNGVYFVGGLVAMSNGQILNSYSHSPTNSTYASSSYGTGSLVGWADSYSQIQYSYGIGTVTGNNILGGLIGICEYDGFSVDTCCWDRLITGIHQDCSNAVSLLTNAMQDKTTFMGWDFDTVWDVDQDQSYPYLQCQV
jgi:hypothetical protein